MRAIIVLCLLAPGAHGHTADALRIAEQVRMRLSPSPAHQGAVREAMVAALEAKVGALEAKVGALVEHKERVAKTASSCTQDLLRYCNQLWAAVASGTTTHSAGLAKCYPCL